VGSLLTAGSNCFLIEGLTLLLKGYFLKSKKSIMHVEHLAPGKLKRVKKWVSKAQFFTLRYH
jgi:hypothetical protein